MLKLLSLFICGLVLFAVADTEPEVTTEDAAKKAQIALECNPESGYTYYPVGSCYKVYKRLLPWVQSNALCSAEGGYMAILNDEKEAQTVGAILREMGVDSVWVGHRDRNSNGHWSSSHGDLQKDIFNVWAQPRAHKLEFKSCGAFNSNVTLSDHSCFDEKYYVCEKIF